MRLILLLLLSNIIKLVVALSPEQLPGVYANLPLPFSPKFCADAIRIAQVEPLLASDSSTLFLIPHFHISLPIRDSSVSIPCISTQLLSSAITSSSSTLLRRYTQIRPRPSPVPLITAFLPSSDEFYLAVELGPRVCGRNVLSNGTISMWMSPTLAINVTIANASVPFYPQYKYIFYWPESAPCLYRGDASERGIVRPIPTPSNSPTPSIRPTPTPTSFPTTIPPTTTLPFFGTSVSPFPDSIVSTQPSDPVCFPANAPIMSKRGPLPIKSLHVGDTVLVNTNQWSTVFAFTHRQAHTWVGFIRIEIHGGCVDMTSGHYLWTNGEYRQAGDVEIGDKVKSVLWGEIDVKWVGCVVQQGLYSVQTENGEIVVGGVVVSTFASFIGGVQEGHAALTGWRGVGKVARWMGWEHRLDRLGEWIEKSVRWMWHHWSTSRH